MLGFGKKKKADGSQETSPSPGDPPPSGGTPPPEGENGCKEYSDEDKAKARQWFQQAKMVGETRNYDYAIQCYISGLEFWPEAVEEGHKPLVGMALARKHAGGKKPGIRDGLKLNMSDKNPKKAMLNAETLFAKEPSNVLYLAGVFRNANKGRFDATMFFIGPMYWDALQREKKPKNAHLMELKDLYESLGDRCQEYDDITRAVEAYESAAKPLEFLLRENPDDLDTMNILRNLTSKLTITKGNYEKAASFQDSVLDKEQQKHLHDKDRLIQSGDRMDELIAAARKDMEANPDVHAKVITLVDLLTRQEHDAYENQAIEILRERFETTGDYRFKRRSDEIKMRQSGRTIRALQKSGDLERAKKLDRKRLKFEIAVFSERAKQYPTDMRIRFQLGLRLMRGRLFDQAIPAFQEARKDPKNRMRCLINIGRCFFEKSLCAQAINMFQEAAAGVEVAGDETSKELYYWMGRSYEADNKPEDAKKCYGQILQWDYNYRDVRERLEGLQAEG